MSNTQPILGEVQGARIIETLQEDARQRIEEVLPDLVQRVEATAGVVPQSVTVTIKYKPGDGDEKPDTFEVDAKLAGKTETRRRAVRVVAGSAEGSRQLVMFG